MQNMGEVSCQRSLLVTISRFWEVLSRKRSLAPTPKRCQRLYDGRNFLQQKWRKVAYFIYQGIGITIPFGLCYVVSILVQVVTLDEIIISLLLGMFTMLLSGMNFCDLITNSDQCSGHVSTAIYQLVGEFPAYCAAVFCSLISCASLAAMTKSLSATMDELFHGKITQFTSSLFRISPGIPSEELVVSGRPPDLVAFGAAIATSGVLACGLKQGGVLRTIMNTVGICFIVFSAIVNIISVPENKETTEKMLSIGSKQELIGSGICCCLFLQFLELGRRSKQSQNNHLNIRVSILSISILVFILSLTLSVSLSLHFESGVPLSGAFAVKVLQLRGLEWACLLLGLMQIVASALGISEAGEIFGRHLVSEASNGFIPHYLSKENYKSFSHSRAHMFGGFTASILALSLSHTGILEFIAANIMSLNIVVVVVTLYRPYRNIRESLCPRSSISPSPTQSSKVENLSFGHPANTRKFSLKLINLKESIQKLKSSSKGNFSRSENEDEIPLLSPLINENEYEAQNCREVIEENTSPELIHQANLSLELRFGNDNEENVELHLRSDSCLEEEMKNDSRSEREIDNIEMSPLSANNKSKNLNAEELNDFLEEEDIDAIIKEYKQKLKITSKGSLLKIPTKKTARLAFLCIVSIILLSILSAIFIHKYVNSGALGQSFITFSVGMILIILIFLIILYKLPSVLRQSQPEVKVNLFCFILRSITALLLNFILLFELIVHVKWMVLPLYGAALLWYTIYGFRNSAAAVVASNASKMNSISDSYYRQPFIDNQIVNLSSQLFPASTYTVRSQSESICQHL